MRFLSIPLLAVAAVLLITACNGKSSSNSSNQTNAAATAGAEAGAATGGSSNAAGTTIPSYPGATTQASGSSAGMSGAASAAGTVLSTDDSFDKVYGWYQQHMPSGSEKSHTTAPVQSAVFMLGETGKDQQSVTITTQGTKTMITIAHVQM
jgi:hypothetical protein